MDIIEVWHTSSSFLEKSRWALLFEHKFQDCGDFMCFKSFQWKRFFCSAQWKSFFFFPNQHHSPAPPPISYPTGTAAPPPSNPAPGYPYPPAPGAAYPPPPSTSYPGTQPAGYPGTQPAGYPGTQPAGYPAAPPRKTTSSLLKFLHTSPKKIPLK